MPSVSCDAEGAISTAEVEEAIEERRERSYRLMKPSEETEVRTTVEGVSSEVDDSAEVGRATSRRSSCLTLQFRRLSASS